ncbi:MAG: hypothetical protein ACJ74W_08655 [Pyrinomonadaceae bacterium]
MLTCQQCRMEIDAAARPEMLTARAGAHVSACATCRTFQTERRALRKLIGELEPVGAPPDFEFRLNARMAARPPAVGPYNFSLFTPRVVGLAITASLVCVFALTLGWHARQPTLGSDTGAPQTAVQVSPPVNSPVGSDPAQKAVAPVLAAVESTTTTTVAASRKKLQRHLPTAGRDVVAQSNVGQSLRPKSEVYDLALHGTPIVTAKLNDNAAASLPPIPVPVSASVKPLQLQVKDMQGETRTISVEAVAFGSRDLRYGRSQPAKTTNDQGVW